jgi:chromosome partitioning protein
MMKNQDPNTDRRGHQMRVIAVVNQKGGVGKTTTTVNVGHALARRGHRVIVVDLDPQGHLAPCLGIYDSGGRGIDKVLLNSAPAVEQLLPVRDRLHLVPAGDDLSDFESIAGGVERAYRVRDAVQELQQRCDFLLIDCAPASGMLVANAIVAADDVLIPMAGDYLSLTGLARLLMTLRRLETMRRRELQQWVFFSRFVPRRRLSREVYDKVAAHLPGRLLRSSVQEAAALAESAGVGKTIFEHRASSRAAREFDALVEDLLHARVVANEQEETSDVA